MESFDDPEPGWHSWTGVCVILRLIADISVGLLIHHGTLPCVIHPGLDTNVGYDAIYPYTGLDRCQESSSQVKVSELVRRMRAQGSMLSEACAGSI